MKRLSLAAALLLAASVPVAAQISVGGVPYSLRHALPRTDVPTVHAAPFDAAAVAAEDAVREQQNKLRLYGRLMPLGADLYNSGLWTVLPNGDRLWRLRVVSDGALATELYFEDMFLPDGAQLYVYDETGDQLLGGFTSFNNRESGSFSTALVMGESSIVEYLEPSAVHGAGSLRITSVGHAYRDVAADACEVDVNCSEGAGWEAQRDAVVRIGVVNPAGAGWCSGSLVNNVTQDCKPYFLTANHCALSDAGAFATAANFQNWKFYFRYQRPGCDAGTALAGKVLTGCTLRGNSNDAGGGSGSDFLLLEAEDATIPDSYTPYWAGWDATGTGSTGGKGIHHPAGDEKKISTYTGATANSTYGGVPGTHWMVTWAGTANGHGVTEGGSSGSPLFNNDHRIIGTLTGGSSCCVTNGCNLPVSGLNSPDFYGKVSYHWNNNPNTANQKLKRWLDPNNTGTLTMDGSYGPCGSLGLSEADAAPAPGVFPNPASGLVSIVYPVGVDRPERIDVLDVTGRTVASLRPTTSGRAELDVAGWSNGTYVVRLMNKGVAHAGARLSVVQP